MKKVGQLMNDMGFNKNASESTKEAFLKHLMKAAEGVQILTPTEKKEIEENGISKIQFHRLTENQNLQNQNQIQNKEIRIEKNIEQAKQLSFSFLEDDREVS